MILKILRSAVLQKRFQKFVEKQKPFFCERVKAPAVFFPPQSQTPPFPRCKERFRLFGKSAESLFVRFTTDTACHPKSHHKKFKRFRFFIDVFDGKRKFSESALRICLYRVPLRRTFFIPMLPLRTQVRRTKTVRKKDA